MRFSIGINQSCKGVLQTGVTKALPDIHGIKVPSGTAV
jgi:hypothetical protein